jgi:hypothetical protein
MNDRVRLLALLGLPTMAGRPGGYRRPLFRGRGDQKSTNLADGTHITQPSPILKIYRDSEGRTRTEHSLLAPAADGQPAVRKLRL